MSTGDLDFIIWLKIFIWSLRIFVICFIFSRIKNELLCSSIDDSDFVSERKENRGDSPKLIPSLFEICGFSSFWTILSRSSEYD